MLLLRVMFKCGLAQFPLLSKASSSPPNSASADVADGAGGVKDEPPGKPLTATPGTLSLAAQAPA